ncbi:galactose oxidase [Gigaspora margarita]|uniref:Galactose oxidase n=1 Tax=Gigaspora margarita TaxID=4874 RepID=A0A8H4ESC4_GIGMA|nr:galactose oxidase [Gigaspora margarita]
MLNSIFQNKKFNICNLFNLNFIFILTVSELSYSDLYARYFQADVLYNNVSDVKWYIFGGNFNANNKSGMNEILYLDLLKPFNANSSPWNKNSIKIPVAISQSALCISSSSIFLIGGNMRDTMYQAANYSSFYTLNLDDSQWTIPNITGVNETFLGRQDLKAVIDGQRRIFLFGGISFRHNNTVFGDMNIINMNTMTSLTLPIQNLPRRGYTATLLKNNCIIYIGGNSNESVDSHIDMNMIHIFNTTSLSWSNMQAIGDTISSRSGHSAVLTQNETIIIYGGGITTGFFPSEPVLAILDTTVNPMRWIIPNDSSTSNAPPSLRYHSATLYNNFMLIAFGRISINTFQLNDRIYIYDIINNNWPTTMDRTLDTTVDATLNNPQFYWLITIKRDSFSMNMTV